TRRGNLGVACDAELEAVRALPERPAKPRSHASAVLETRRGNLGVACDAELEAVRALPERPAKPRSHASAVLETRRGNLGVACDAELEAVRALPERPAKPRSDAIAVLRDAKGEVRRRKQEANACRAFDAAVGHLQGRPGRLRRHEAELPRRRGVAA